MTSKLAIFGAGGHGKVIADIAECLGWQNIAFYDDIWPNKTQVHRWSVVGNYTQLQQQCQDWDGVVVAIGHGRTRLSRLEDLMAHQAPLCTLIHPTAYISPYATLGIGTVVMPNASVNAFACIGRGGIINTNASIDHDCVIGHGVHICPGSHLAGSVHVGDCSWIGIGSSVIQQVRIGSDVMVGAGSVILKDVPSHTTMVGNPARPLHSNK